MMRPMFCRATLVLLAWWLPSQSPPLEARFIGNMAVAISDGSVTLFTDFPYESGYSRYMTYPAREIHSPTAMTLSLITHRHGDHWQPALFAKTNWHVAGPSDAVTAVPAARVLPLTPKASFGPLAIEALATPHAGIGHFSYVVTWHGRRMYFSGDTEDSDHLLALKDLDTAFVSPWLYRSVLKRSERINARQIVIYHHESGEQVPECVGSCMLPKQGDTFAIK
jgi:L-ascorbate metabolism protein UlaG (beta-lactamase superfamily)